LAGFLATLSKLEERSSKITSLHGFLEQANEIIKGALLDTDQELWVVCPSPYIGNLSVRDTKVQIAFAKLIEDAAYRLPLILVCPSPEVMADYYLKLCPSDPNERYPIALCREAFQEMKQFLQMAT